METAMKNTAVANPVLDTIYSRRAVRKYKDIPVETDMIEAIIDAGRMAPSAMNRQSWKFYVVRDRELIRTFSKAIHKIAVREFIRTGAKQILKSIVNLLHFPHGTKFLKEADHVFHGAPAVIFITGPRDNEWAALDTGMCAQNMMLAAKSLGLESCPVGFAKYIEHTDEYIQLHIPLSEEVLIAIITGYGDEQPEVHPRNRHNIIFIE